MIQYNWQHSDWPHFIYSLESLEERLLLFMQKAGELTGILKSLPDDARQATMINLMLQRKPSHKVLAGQS